VTGYIQRLQINITNDDHYFIQRCDFWTQLATRGYPADKLDQYFNYYPRRAILLENIRTTPKSQETREAFIVFKIRMSTRTILILKQLKQALEVIPIEQESGIYHKPQLKQILKTRIRPIICFPSQRASANHLSPQNYITLYNLSAKQTQAATKYPRLQAYVRSLQKFQNKR
jgi:hypothetical protein